MSLKQEFELLRRVPFFAEIEPAKLKLLAFMSERVGFDAGKLIVRQGDPADAAYLIIDGEAEVVVTTPAGPVTVATLGPNEIVGEIAILVQYAAQRYGAGQKPSDRAAYLKGAVHANGARVPENGGNDHAGIGAAAVIDQQSVARSTGGGKAAARTGRDRRLIHQR